MWNDDFKDLMIGLPFIPGREMIVAHVDVSAAAKDYAAVEFVLGSLIQAYKPLPTLEKALSRIYDEMMQEKTIATTGVELLNFIDGGNTDVH